MLGRLPIISYKSNYFDKVKSIAPANLIGYWPLDEASGSVATDYSGNARHGAYTAVTLGQTGIGDGRTGAAFDGSTSYCNIYSAGLAAAFNPDEGTMAVWIKVAAAQWIDGIEGVMFNLDVDGATYARITKSTTNNLVSFNYRSSATNHQISNACTATTWQHVAAVWSQTADTVDFYLNGTPGTQKTPVAAWVGSLASTRTLLGARLTTPATLYTGNLAHAALWSTPLTAAQILALATV